MLKWTNELLPFILLLPVSTLIVLILYLRERIIVKRYKRAQSEQIRQIQAFLEHSDAPAYSLVDEEGAQLRNEIAQLEERVLLLENRIGQERSRQADFVADISHQLKTLLAALRLYNELTQHAYSDKELLLIERMEDLIARLLRLEKLRSGAYEINFAEQDLRGLILDAWDEVQPLYPERTLQIAGATVQRCDAFWLREAFHNILKNACQQPAADPNISMTIKQNQATTSIGFEDHGGGVDPARLSSLFERFSRSGAEVSDGKSGLGLAITKAIVQQHHGTIFAENTSDGLRISIVLPVLEGYKRWE